MSVKRTMKRSIVLNGIHSTSRVKGVRQSNTGRVFGERQKGRMETNMSFMMNMIKKTLHKYQLRRDL